MNLKFPSIEQFNNVHKRETWSENRRALTYRAKIKIHGTNIGVRISPGGEVVAHSRSQADVVNDDLMGFADYLGPQSPAWSEGARDEVVTIYGEWAGPGINKGTAIQETDTRRFFVFAVGLGEAPHHQDPGKMTPRCMVTDPDDIAALLPDGVDTDRVRVLPFVETPYVFDFSDREALAATLEALNADIASVALKDPYVAETFGVEGPGEGYVLVPHATLSTPVVTETYARLAFKAKSEKFRVQKQKKPATDKAPLPRDATDFVETYCTPQRVEQAIDEVCQGDPDVSQTGAVIKWVTADIHKEAGDDIAALIENGVPAKRLNGPIADATRSIFMARLQSV